MSMARDAYITEDFLLETKAARQLYHEYAEHLPIVDYHCHLPPREIAEDKRWETITQIWLYGDHYKWRAMRSNGVDERFCTGDASDWEKFEKWAETVPYLLRNQLYNWTHLELKRYFGISDKLLGPDTAKDIWDACNEQVQKSSFSCRGLMRQSEVRLVCTTDDPTDSLEHHKAIQEDEAFGIRVLPAWRPDKGMAVEDPETFNGWLDKLASAADIDITDWDSYMEALRKRHDFFSKNGCRLSDHGLETAYADDYTEPEVAAVFNKIRGGTSLDPGEMLKFKSAMLHEFGIMDWEKGWAQQYHFAALRNNNTRLFKKLGPDTGFDSIGDFELARPLSRMLDRLDQEDKLAKTVFYSLNPCHNALLVTMLGNFQDGSVPGKMQLGSAWWHLDQKDGMERQIEDLSQTGLLSRFVGMLTDSRSFLSYTRHEYFRRILCNLVGNDMTKGIMPDDIELAGRMVRDICYNNAVEYFKFDLSKVE
jgi:glucuronate isomerase